MKRTAMLLWAAILALALTLGAAAAAEGEATADVDAPALYELDQENCYFYDLFGDYVRYMTKFTNIGGTGLYISGGSLKLMDAEGSVIWDSGDYSVYAYDYFVTPGQSTYLIVDEEIDVSKDDVTAYELTLEVTAYEYEYEQGDYTYLKVSDVKLEDGYVFALLTNPADGIAWDCSLRYAIENAEGKLMQVYDSSMYGFGLPAGGSMWMKASIFGSISDAWAKVGDVPTNITVTAWITNE